jgi:metallo-beta-lactamase class B
LTCQRISGLDSIVGVVLNAPMQIYRLVLLFVLAIGCLQPAIWAQTVRPMTVEEAIAFVDPKSPTYINGSEEQQMHPIPHKIVGNLYYVGSETLSSFLVTTPQGHILINSTYEKNVPLIRQSVEKLGFNFRDIKVLVTSHGHTDHVEGDALVKQLTDAQVVMMAEDVPLVQKVTPGGKPHPVDRVIHHREEVALGGTTLIAHLTPAHTPGCTTWTMRIPEGGQTYNVVIQGCGIGTGPLVDANGKMTKEVDEYIATFKYLRALPCDIFLAAHGTQYNLKAKYDNIGNGPNPFIDPQGYQTALDNWEKYFIVNLSQQLKAAMVKK